jgi:hypothetical protein
MSSIKSVGNPAALLYSANFSFGMVLNYLEIPILWGMYNLKIIFRDKTFRIGLSGDPEKVKCSEGRPVNSMLNGPASRFAAVNSFRCTNLDGSVAMMR